VRQRGGVRKKRMDRTAWAKKMSRMKLKLCTRAGFVAE
jgi:hypothetical protein